MLVQAHFLYVIPRHFQPGLSRLPSRPGTIHFHISTYIPSPSFHKIHLPVWAGWLETTLWTSSMHILPSQLPPSPLDRLHSARQVTTLSHTSQSISPYPISSLFLCTAEFCWVLRALFASPIQSNTVVAPCGLLFAPLIVYALIYWCLCTKWNCPLPLTPHRWESNSSIEFSLVQNFYSTSSILQLTRARPIHKTTCSSIKQWYFNETYWTKLFYNVEMECEDKVSSLMASL